MNDSCSRPSASKPLPTGRGAATKPSSSRCARRAITVEDCGPDSRTTMSPRRFTSVCHPPSSRSSSELTLTGWHTPTKDSDGDLTVQPTNITDLINSQPDRCWARCDANHNRSRAHGRGSGQSCHHSAPNRDQQPDQLLIAPLPCETKRSIGQRVWTVGLGLTF